MDGNEQNLAQLLQQAKTLSELLQGGGRREESGGVLDSFEKAARLAQLLSPASEDSGGLGSMGKILQLAQALSLDGRAGEPAAGLDGLGDEPEDNVKAFDEMVSAPSIDAMKAALPYADPSLHRSLGLWIKLMEMQRIFDLTAGGEPLVAPKGGTGDWRLDMLSAMRPYAGAEKRALIDSIVRMAGLLDTFMF